MQRGNILILVALCLGQFCEGMSYSLLGPFYPVEAEKRGVTPTQYGFVFGIMELILFIFCPLFGNYLGVLGAKFVNCCGIFVLGVTVCLFGMLEIVRESSVFLSLSFAIRIVQALGAAAALTSCYCIAANEFQNEISFAFSLMLFSYGIGQIVGPFIGSILYEVGGFLLPFVVVGCLTVIDCILACIFLPSQEKVNCPTSLRMMASLLTKPQILIGCFEVIVSAFGWGFYQATLEPHVQSLNLTSYQIGALFVIIGSSYTVTTPIVGKICDRLNPYLIGASATLTTAIAFAMVGPAPFISLKISFTTVSVSLFFYGIGLAAMDVASFSALQKDILALGFPDDISTYGLVSGFWNSLFALGLFIGPSAAGILYDLIGFSWASLTVIGFNLILFSGLCILLCKNIIIISY